VFAVWWCLQQAAAAPPVAVEGDRPPEDVKQAIMSGAEQMNDCYREALERREGAGGVLRVRFRVEPSGAVVDVEATEALDDPQMQACMLDVVRSYAFAPAEQEAMVTWPFVFGQNGPKLSKRQRREARVCLPAEAAEHQVTLLVYPGATRIYVSGSGEPTSPQVERCLRGPLRTYQKAEGFYLLTLPPA